MHVRTKRMATAGLLVAFIIVMLVLSSVIETNTLFFIAAASFCVGIAIREWGLKFGAAFLVAALILGVLLAPNKLYCITFAGMGIYIWLSELLWEKAAGADRLKHRNLTIWIGKYLIFNVIYIPVLIFMPSLIFSREISAVIAIILFLGGQAVLFVYDTAYRYFQDRIWGRMRERLMR